MTYPQQQPAYPAQPQPTYQPPPAYPAQPQQPAYPAPAPHPAFTVPQPPAPAPAPVPAPAPMPQPPAPAPAPPSPQPVPPPTPAPVPQQPAPAVPQPPANPQTPPAPAGGPAQPSQPATGDDTAGFPANTPWRDMTATQQVAYWQHQARRHEDRVKQMGDYDQVKQQAEEYQRMVVAQQTEQQRAVADAHRQGREQALAETGGQLVEQWVRAAAAGRIPPESVNALLAGLNRQAFLNAQGGVDTDRVYQFVYSVAPQQPVSAPVPGAAIPGQQPQVTVPPPTQQVVPQNPAPAGGPDFGQGQPAASKTSGIAAGREIARQRFAANTPSTPAPATN